MTSTGPTQPTIEEGLAALRRRWPELFVEDEQDSPIFVLAAGWRSGSTLLQRLLVEYCLVWGEPYGHSWPIPSLADPLRCFTEDWPEPHHFHVGQPTEQLAATLIANLHPGARDFKDAHRAFFRRLFASSPIRHARPATSGGASRKSGSMPITPRRPAGPT